MNTSLQDSGFGPTLLCSLVAFTDGTRTLGLVYLYKQGTFYPFAPAEGPGTTVDGTAVQRRDNVLELQVRRCRVRGLLQPLVLSLHPRGAGIEVRFGDGSHGGSSW